jgi:hypothetical protein
MRNAYCSLKMFKHSVPNEFLYFKGDCLVFGSVDKNGSIKETLRSSGKQVDGFGLSFCLPDEGRVLSFLRKTFKVVCHILGNDYFHGYHRLFPVVAQRIGVKVRQIPVNHFPREHGTSNYGFGRTLHVLRHVWALYSDPMLMQEHLSYKVKNIVQGT